MKIRNFCLLLVALVAFASCSSDENEELIGNWKTLGSFDGAARSDATGFVIGDTAYICLGYNRKSEALSDLWRYNPSDKTWKPRASFPGAARYAASSFVVNGKAYVGLGFDGIVPLKDFWEYDPKTDTWTQVAEVFPGEARYFAVAEGVGGVGVVGTGFDYGDNYKDFFKFTPGTGAGSGTWQPISSYEGAKRQGACTFVIGNYMYLLGGSSNESNPSDMQRYNPSSNQWEKVLDLMNTDLTSLDDKYGNIPRAFACAFVMNGKGYITLGTKGNSHTNTTYEYDPVANLFLERTPFTRSARSGAVAFSLQNRGFIMTGKTGTTRFDDFFEFFPNEANNQYDDY